MALLPSELVRLRYELGYNLLTVGAEPWIGVASAFDNVIGPYLRSGASTTSSTAVVAASAPTPTPITLADATGFDVGARVVVDVDARQEIVTVQSISGLIITVVLKNAHTGSYPVTVEGGESIVRDILTKLRNVSDKLESASTKAGIKRVDEIEFFGDSRSDTVFSNLRRQREYWRDELSSAIGLARRNQSGGGGSRVSVY
jgi:hypothetical protein